MEAYIGAIIPVAFNFPPEGWQLCQGQLVSINSNQALFALLGTIYGGDGIQTFGLPDLRGRTAIGQGQGPNLTNRTIGDKSGAESAPITAANLPAHIHTLTGTPTVTGGGAMQASPKAGTVSDPTGNYMANAEIPAQGSTAAIKANSYVPPAQAGTLATMAGTAVSISLSGVAVASAGTASPAAVPTVSPFVCVNYIICTEGIFPTRQ